jgi:Holliday junction resolvase
MSRYRKGARYERELIDYLWEEGFAVVRVAGSGASKKQLQDGKRPLPDLVAGRKGVVYAVACRFTKEKKAYFKRHEIEELREFSRIFGCTPIVAVRFKGNKDWVFIPASNLKETEKRRTTNGNFVVGWETLEKRFKL